MTESCSRNNQVAKQPAAASVAVYGRHPAATTDRRTKYPGQSISSRISLELQTGESVG